MRAGDQAELALLVAEAPYTGREPRAELDIAIAALALDRSVDVYFIGPAVLHLQAERDAAAALLPPGFRAWPALEEWGAARLYADSRWVERCERLGIGLAGSFEVLDAAAMSSRWRNCKQVLSL